MFATIKRFGFEIGFVIVLACLYGAFSYGQFVQKLENEQDLNKQRISMQAKIDDEYHRRQEIAERFEKKLDSIQIVNTTINRTVQKEIEKQIYTDCKYPVTGSELINSNAKQLNDARNTK